MQRLLLFLLMPVWINVAIGQELKDEQIRWYDFYWEGDSATPKEVMLLKSRIDTVNFNFKWQFDTGSPRTFVYGNVWNSFCTAFPYLQHLFTTIDTLKRDGFVNLKNGGVKISGNNLPERTIGLLSNYGDQIDKEVILSNLGASVILGTIGIDMFRQGVLVIDFKKNKIGFARKLSHSFYTQKKNTVDFMLYQNRIILPLKVGKEIFYFFYDSGASLFPLKTSAAFTNLTQHITYTDTLRNITTWGKSFDVPGGNFKNKVNIGKLKISNPKIYVHPDPDNYHTNIFKEAETYGLIGNAYFENSVIVIDFTKMKFTIQ
jgi:hypothetical protein